MANHTTQSYDAPVAATIHWQTTIPGSLAHSMWVDPARNRLLLADGWGCTYAEIRLRALSLFDGVELASTRLGNAARAVALCDDGSLLAATDTKLFRLDGATLAEVERWTSKVPRYSDAILVAGNFAHVCNSAAPSLYAINLSNGTIRRRNLGDSLRIHPWSQEGLLITCGQGKVWLADTGLESTPRTVVSTQPFCDSVMDERGRLWLSLGNRIERTQTSERPIPPTSHMAFIDLAESTALIEADLGVPFWDMAVSKAGDRLSVIGLTTAVLGGETRYYRTDVISFRAADLQRTAWVRVPDGYTIALVAPGENIGWATRAIVNSQTSAAELICFSLSS